MTNDVHPSRDFTWSRGRYVMIIQDGGRTAQWWVILDRSCCRLKKSFCLPPFPLCNVLIMNYFLVVSLFINRECFGRCGHFCLMFCADSNHEQLSRLLILFALFTYICDVHKLYQVTVILLSDILCLCCYKAQIWSTVALPTELQGLVTRSVKQRLIKSGGRRFDSRWGWSFFFALCGLPFSFLGVTLRRKFIGSLSRYNTHVDCRVNIILWSIIWIIIYLVFASEFFCLGW